MKINKIKALSALVGGCLLVAQTAAAETVYREANPYGWETVVPLDPSMAGKTIALYAVSPSPEFQTVDVGVRGIGGERVAVDAFTIDGTEPALLALQRERTPLDLWFFKTSFAQMRVTAPDPTCGCLAEIEKIVAVSSTQSQFPGLTINQLCDALRQSTPAPKDGVCREGSDSSAGSAPVAPIILGTAFVPYNRCVATFRPGVVVNIDLTNISAASLQGATLGVKILLRKFNGASRGNWATFKVSDGKKFPGWIALTEMVSSDGTFDNLQFVTWSAGGRGKAQARVRSAPRRGDRVFYAGRFFKRTPINNLLSGGKGTVEVARYGEGYGFCANFTKKARQNFNGYKKLG